MQMNGILNIFKPKGISSQRTVSELKNILNIKKAGHAGTLDPAASGVLLVCTGYATRIVEFLTDLHKHYTGEMNLGIITDTQDSEGEILQRKEVSSDIDNIKVKKIFKLYQGTIAQIPPMYSAVHYKGKRLYHLARRGIEVPRNPKTIKIYKLKLLNFTHKKNPVIKFEVECSRGTYVRTLCSDIGNKLGCGAHLSNLIREKIGNFSIKDSLYLEDLKNDKALGKKYLIKIDSALRDLNRIVVDQDNAKIVLNGGQIANSQIIKTREITKAKNDKFVKILDTKKNCLAIGLKISGNNNDIIFKPIKVFKNI